MTQNSFVIGESLSSPYIYYSEEESLSSICEYDTKYYDNSSEAYFDPRTAISEEKHNNNGILSQEQSNIIMITRLEFAIQLIGPKNATLQQIQEYNHFEGLQNRYIDNFITQYRYRLMEQYNLESLDEIENQMFNKESQSNECLQVIAFKWNNQNFEGYNHYQINYILSKVNMPNMPMNELI